MNPNSFARPNHFYSDTAGRVAEFHGAVDVKADEKSQLSSSLRYSAYRRHGLRRSHFGNASGIVR